MQPSLVCSLQNLAPLARSHPPPSPPALDLSPQNRVRQLRTLGLENAEVARLLQEAPSVLAVPPVVNAPVLSERMQLLGLPSGALHSFVAQCPAVVPLLLKHRLSTADVAALRRQVAQLAELAPSQATL